jgi:aspartate aminotransferase
MTLSLNVARMQAVKPSATLGMAAKAKALSKQGVDVVNLSAGEPDFATPHCIVDAARRVLDKRSSHAYTAPRGTDDLLEAIGIKLAREQGTSYEVNETIATVGTKGALMLAIDALCGPGDEVILFAPYWVTYADLVRLSGATPVVIHTTRENGYQPTMEDFEKALTPRTKLVILNSPNNPTGTGWPEALLRSIMSRLESTDTWVISDEIYEKLTFGDFKHVSPVSFGDDAKGRTIYVGGVAKAYAMTGWRVGIAAGPKLAIDAMLTLQSQRTTCATAIAQVAAAYALRETSDVVGAVDEMRSAYKRRRKLVLERVRAIPGVHMNPPDGAFYAFLDLNERLAGKMVDGVAATDLWLANSLLEQGRVATVMGSAFEGDGCLRVSFAASENDINRGFDRIVAFLNERLPV